MRGLDSSSATTQTPSRVVDAGGLVDFGAEGSSLHYVSEMRRRGPAGAALAGVTVKLKLQAVDEERRVLRTFAKVQVDLAQYASVRRSHTHVRVPLMIYPAFRSVASGSEQALLSMHVMSGSLTHASAAVWSIDEGDSWRQTNDCRLACRQHADCGLRRWHQYR